ncbi:MAG: hypothetical protein JW751_03450 [Polyangiaceae bacterium]|nr:hypothetical protein [Polyangiaceae bacterium]
MTTTSNGVTWAAMLAALLGGGACGGSDNDAAAGGGGSGGTDTAGGDGGADTGGSDGGTDTAGGDGGADTGVGGGGEPLAVDERADSAEQVVLDLAGSPQNPAWGPDSSTLVFTRFVDGYNSEPADLFIVELPDGEPRVLVQDGSGNVNLPGSSWNDATALIPPRTHEPALVAGDRRPGSSDMTVHRRPFSRRV